MSLIEDKSELLPLVPTTNSINTTIIQPTPTQWSTTHTCIILFVRLLIDFAFKHPFLFYSNYATALNITNFDFALVLIASEIGCISALFLGPMNERWFKTSKNIIIAYLNLGGLSCILFIIPFFTPSSMTGFTIIWCCLCRLLTGISFSFLSAATINFASQNSRHSHTTNDNTNGADMDTANTVSIIAILHFSWPLSTSLNIGSGYLIQYLSWIWVFILIGSVLCLSSLIVLYMPSLNMFGDGSAYDIINDQSMNDAISEDLSITTSALTLETMETMDETEVKVDENERESQDSMTIHRKPQPQVQIEEGWEGLTKLLFDWRSMLILFTSFWMTFRSRSIYIVISSFWMETVFDMSASDVGLTNICIVAGEALSPLFVTYYLKKYTLQVSALGTLVSEILVTVCFMLILACVYGNTLGSLASVLVLIVLLTFTHQCFYILQQANAIQYAPEKHLSLLLLLGERMFQEFGSIVALLMTAMLWNDFFVEGAVLFSVVWTVSALAMGSVLFIYVGDFQQKM